MPVTDVQVHLWEPERPDRPWPKPQQRPPHRPNGFSAEEMLNEMDAAGVDRAVIVPPTWAGDSNEWALDVAARYPKRFAVVGRFDVNPPDARGQLEGWLKQPHMLGVRMSFHVKPFIDWLEDGSLDWFWATCEQYAIPVMALVPGMPGKIRPIAERHPALPILIPHLGFSLDARGPAAFACLDELLALARYPSVVVNVSSRAELFQRAVSVPGYSSNHPAHLRHLRTAADAVGSRPQSAARHLPRLSCPVPRGTRLPSDG